MRRFGYLGDHVSDVLYHSPVVFGLNIVISAAYIVKRLPDGQNVEPLRRQRRDSSRLESIVTEPFSGESSSVITTESPTVAQSSGTQVGAGEPEVLRERRAPVGDDRAVEVPREHILLSTPYSTATRPKDYSNEFVRVHLTASRY